MTTVSWPMVKVPACTLRTPIHSAAAVPAASTSAVSV